MSLIMWFQKYLGGFRWILNALWYTGIHGWQHEHNPQ